tara:strand:+ start:390 stop:512 length:123 start_codon:yes stop_codon:yes gene_type:complete
MMNAIREIIRDNNRRINLFKKMLLEKYILKYIQEANLFAG